MPTPLKALERIEECRNGRIPILNLSSCGLTEIPIEIENFVWLQNLYLHFNKIGKIEGLSKLVNITKLDISYNNITTITGLENLVNIANLSISKNQILKIEGLENLVNLANLSLSKNQIIKIEGLENLVQISELDLYSNQITKIEGLSNLVKISTIFLSKNKIAKIEGLSSLINISKLVISRNKITKIEGLDKLINISKLDLFSNQINEIEGLQENINLLELDISDNQIAKIKGLEKLIKLSKIALNSNKISKIEGLSKLINLITLNLCYNQNNRIEGLEELNKISELYLNNNQINRISGLEKNIKISKLILTYNQITKIEGLDNLVNIAELDFSNNQIIKIENLENLINISKLDFSNNQIIKIRGLENLINILSLNLTNNRILNIEGLDKLYNVQKLYLSSNNIQRIVRLSNLKQLSRLDISSNSISKIEGVNKLINLNFLDISINKIGKIEGIDKLINLSELLLHSNKIQKIEGLDQLENLSVLFLSYNQINSLDGLSKLKNLLDLKIDNNPIEIKYNLVLEEFENHWKIIKNKIDRESEVGKDVTVILPAKILLLGNHASGKSSLLHYLQNKNLEYSGDSTHLLKIEYYPNSNNPEAIFYDFGGQDYYHGIYRAFLSVGSGYLLLWDKDNNENKISTDSKGLLTQNFKVNYWLGQKRHFESSKFGNEQDPILLVQTHAQYFQAPKYVFEHQDDAIQNTFYVSLSEKYNPDKNKASMEYLKAEIDALIATKKREINEKEWYVKFYEYVFHEKIIQAVSIDKLLTYYKPTNKKDYEEILNSLQDELQNFHNQGLVLYYPDIDKNIVWLNPAGLVEYVHEHILQEKLINKFDGIVPFEEFKKVDKNIIALLEKQKVLFNHPFGDNGIEYIVPNFLPLVKNNETEYDLFTFGLSNPLFTLKFEQFLPIGLINQMICFFGRQPDKKKFWRDQLLFTFEKKCKVLIRLDFELLEIKILVSFLKTTKTQQQEQIGKYLFYCIMTMYWGFEPDINKNYADTDRKENKELIKSEDEKGYKWAQQAFTSIGKFISVLFEFKFSPQDLFVSRDDKYFVRYTLLIAHDIKETRIVSHTLNNDRTLSEKTVEIPVKPFELFTDKKMNAMKKVFISYSKDDLSMVHRFRDALIPLHDDGIIESPWYCTFLEAGSLWDAEIQQKLQESDIVFFMCSMSFIRTKYIREHEIKTAIESNKTIIPVILNFCEWDRYLGDYTALPYTSKPVADFHNQDLAWLLVVSGVRKSLEETNQEELGKQIKKLYERLVEGKLDKNSE